MTTRIAPGCVLPGKRRYDHAGTGVDGPAIEVLGIDNVLIPVGDLDRAVAFYRDALDLTLRFRLDPPGLALFDLGREPAGLLARVQPEPPAGSGMRVWLEVPDARRAA